MNPRYALPERQSPREKRLQSLALLDERPQQQQQPQSKAPAPNMLDVIQKLYGIQQDQQTGPERLRAMQNSADLSDFNLQQAQAESPYKMQGLQLENKKAQQASDWYDYEQQQKGALSDAQIGAANATRDALPSKEEAAHERSNTEHERATNAKLTNWQLVNSMLAKPGHLSPEQGKEILGPGYEKLFAMPQAEFGPGTAVQSPYQIDETQLSPDVVQQLHAKRAAQTRENTYMQDANAYDKATSAANKELGISSPSSSYYNYLFHRMFNR